MSVTTYLAIPDPTQPDTMTYWRRSGDELSPWPSGAKYGPLLYRRHLPAGIRGRERTEWVRQWCREVRDPWWQALRVAVFADTGDAAALFAKLTTRCRACARKLTDAESQLLGIGPDCRGSR